MLEVSRGENESITDLFSLPLESDSLIGAIPTSNSTRINSAHKHI
jgi:hypothetical protein